MITEATAAVSAVEAERSAQSDGANGDSSKPTVRDAEIDEVKLKEKGKLPFIKGFYMEWHNPDDGKILSGNFCAKRLTIGELGQMGVIKAQLNAGSNVDLTTDWIHEQIAY